MARMAQPKMRIAVKGILIALVSAKMGPLNRAVS
jgi:hypothetical protein